MWYALIWVEVLALSLLAVSITLSISSGCTTRWKRITCPALTSLAVFGLLGFLTVASGQFYFRNIVPTWLFGYTLSLFVVFIFGYSWVMRCGLKQTAPDKKSTAAGWSLRGLCLLFLSALSLHLITVLAADLGVRSKISSLQTRGCSMIPTLLPPRVPDSRNAYYVYEAATDCFIYSKPEDNSWGDWAYDVEKPDFDPAAAGADKIIEQNTSALKLLHKAADMERCYFETDYFNPSYDIPSLLDARNAANLIALSARCHAANKNPDAAMADISAIRALAKHIGTTPNLISAMISLSISGIGDQTFENILGSMHPNYDKMTIDSYPHIIDVNSVLWRAFKMEEAIALNLMSACFNEENFSNVFFDTTGLTFFDLFSVYIRIFMVPPDIDYYCSTIHELQQTARKPYYKTRSIIAAMNPNKYHGLFSGIMMPSLKNCKDASDRTLVLQQISCTALGAVHYYKENRQFPKTLNELVPEYISSVPQDPFNGKPIKLKSVNDGLVLYSVGSNGKDDGGIENETDKDKGDIIFCLGTAYREQRYLPAVEQRKKAARRRVKKQK